MEASILPGSVGHPGNTRSTCEVNYAKYPSDLLAVIQLSSALLSHGYSGSPLQDLPGFQGFVTRCLCKCPILAVTGKLRRIDNRYPALTRHPGGAFSVVNLP